MPESLRPKINTKDILAILASEDTGRNGLIMTEVGANALAFRTQQVIDQPATINSGNIQKLFVLFQRVQHYDAWNFAVKYIEVLDRFGRAKTEREIMKSRRGRASSELSGCRNWRACEQSDAGFAGDYS